MIACHHGYEQIVKILLENGADLLAEDSVKAIASRGLNIFG
jgi:hypothetical protein